MNISVIGGAGYVGLVTGLGLAEIGHEVVNVDVDQDRVTRLQKGDSPLYEEGIGPLLQSNVEAGRICFTTDMAEAVRGSDIVMVAVGTPSRDDGQSDLSQVIQVAEEMVALLDSYKVVVIKSTVPVGTVELVLSILQRDRQEGRDFDIVSNPEFLREGKAIQDFFYPDRIVIGSRSAKALQTVRQMYGPVIERKAPWPKSQPISTTTTPVPVVETDLASAQLIKYASNAFLATRISFVNEIAGLCDAVGADVKEVTSGMGYDARIGHSYLEAGLGFGGPCLEKDLRALIKMAESNSHEPHLLHSVLERNDRQITDILTKIKSVTGYLLYKKIVAVFGLSFKAGTNDVRNSLALRVLDRLDSEGAVAKAHDPASISEARLLRPGITYCEDPYEAVDQADVLLILTEWPSFQELDYGAIKERMASPRIVDGRNLLDGSKLRELGFTYVGVGRP